LATWQLARSQAVKGAQPGPFATVDRRDAVRTKTNINTWQVGWIYCRLECESQIRPLFFFLPCGKTTLLRAQRPLQDTERSLPPTPTTLKPPTTHGIAANGGSRAVININCHDKPPETNKWTRCMPSIPWDRCSRRSRRLKKSGARPPHVNETSNKCAIGRLQSRRRHGGAGRGIRRPLGLAKMGILALSTPCVAGSRALPPSKSQVWLGHARQSRLWGRWAVARQHHDFYDTKPRVADLGYQVLRRAATCYHGRDSGSCTPAQRPPLTCGAGE